MNQTIRNLLLLYPCGRPYYKKVLSYAPTAYWPLWEPSGYMAKSLVVNDVAAENLLSYGGFETDSASHGLTFAGWQQRVGTGAIADEGVLVHSGSHAAKLTRGTDDNTWIYEDVKVVPGDSLSLSFWARGDGSVSGRYAAYDRTNSAWIIGFTTTGVTGAAYAEVTDTVIVPATCGVIRLYLAVSTSAGDVYFDDVSLDGQGVLDGAYPPSGATLGQPGIGDGHTSAQFTGVATSVYIGSNRFDAVWNGDKGSAIAWGRMSAAQWADVAEYRYLFHPKSANDAHYYVAFGKASVANRLAWRRKVGLGLDTNEQTYTFGAAPGGWVCMGYVWDITVPNLRGYLYAPDDLAFTEVFDIAGADMNAWGTHPVNDINTVLMAGSTEAQEWTGWGAHVAYWAGQAFTAVQMQQLMDV